MEDIKQKMQERLEKYQNQIHKLRTGKANPAILETVKIDYYGTLTPLKQLANISQPEGRVLQVQPFDKSLLIPIEKTLLSLNLGVTPSNDGNVIRLPFPLLTEETRKLIVKDLKMMTEEGKVALRNIRRDFLDSKKIEEKEGIIREDELKNLQEKIQKVLDEFISKVDQSFHKKEQEIFQV